VQLHRIRNKTIVLAYNFFLKRTIFKSVFPGKQPGSVMVAEVGWLLTGLPTVKQWRPEGNANPLVL
jgi:hypothetical protein